MTGCLPVWPNCSPSRLMDGILLIDKPPGMTSHDVVRRVRRACKTRRVGHTGTLDPMATGVLVVAVGEGTRIVQFLMEGRKSYRATLKLGETTDTQDADGTVIARSDWSGVTEAAIRQVLAGLCGPQQQLPPMYSALKKDGVALHTLARQGVEVERSTRSIEIYAVRLLAIELPFVTFEVDCSKGTYVRTLAHDAGALLGPGGHLTALRRIENSGFRDRQCLSLETLEQTAPEQLTGLLLDIASALSNWPQVFIEGEPLVRLLNGIPPTLAEVSQSQELAEGTQVKLCNQERLVALAQVDTSRENEKRGDFELLRVFSRTDSH